MFRNIYKLMFGLLLMFAFFNSNILNAQTTTMSFNSKITDLQPQAKIVYPLFSISPLFGIQFPVANLNNTYKSSFVGGLDINMKVNRETSFFLNASYYDMPIKTDLQGPGAAVISITVGPRYTFTSNAVRAAFFLEAGLGVYMFHTQDYTYPNYINGQQVTIASATTTNFGVNVGPGVIIPLGGAADLLLKVKLHDILASGGSSTFVAGVVGVDFRL